MSEITADRTTNIVDETTLNEILDSLRQTAGRLGVERADVDDVVQDCCIRAFERWRCSAPADNPHAYLRSVLKNLVRDRWRRRAVRPYVVALDEAPVLPPPPERAEERIAVAEIAASVGALSTEMRDVLELVAFEGASYREAADRLGLPIGTVMSRLHRARREVRAYMGGERR